MSETIQLLNPVSDFRKISEDDNLLKSSETIQLLNPVSDEFLEKCDDNNSRNWSETIQLLNPVSDPLPLQPLFVQFVAKGSDRKAIASKVIFLDTPEPRCLALPRDAIENLNTALYRIIFVTMNFHG